MRRLLWITLSFFFLVAANVGVAASRPITDTPYLAINGPWTRAEFDAKRHDRSFGFVASAGESVSIEIDGSTFADACAVDLRVLDSADRVVREQTCVASRGQVTTLNIATDGHYRMQLLARNEGAGAISVALRVASRPVSELPLACIQAALPLDSEVSGTWDAGCASVSRPGSNAQYYTISVPSDQVITISLGSAVDSFVVLYAGSAPGALVNFNDNGGPGTDSLLALNLQAGTYTIEATTFLPGQVGNFAVAARTNTAPCFGRLNLNRTVRSSWITSCASIASNDYYARYFALSVPTDEVVTITATSSVDTFLVLRSGPSQLGGLVIGDDNSGSGTNSQIVQRLLAGEYTVEVRTATPGELGRFSVVARTNDRPCFGSVALGATVSGKWTKACTSTSFAGGDHFAKYYTLEVPNDQTVSIILQSATNAFLVLRPGDDQLGGDVLFDDNSGGGLNAKITFFLPAGIYTIDATTALPGELGNFTLTIAP